MLQEFGNEIFGKQTKKLYLAAVFTEFQPNTCILKTREWNSILHVQWGQIKGHVSWPVHWIVSEYI